MAKLFLFYNCFITAVFALTGFAGAQSLRQVMFALMFIPVCIYFIRRLTARPHTNPVTISTPHYSGISLSERETAIEGEELSATQVSDINRRLFLKLIGTAGLTTFLFALFAKSSRAAFFGSVPGPGTVALKDSHGNKIDPAEKGPTDGFEISQVDDSGVPAYYGFVNKDGAWYIAMEGAGGEYRYIRGGSNFATSWTQRGTLIYDYFNNVF